VIYLDTSVVLAHLLAEDRCPPASLWDEALVSSRLLEYEVWVQLNWRGLADSRGEAATDLLSRIALLELDPPQLARVLDPFPIPVRALDAIHLASADLLHRRTKDVRLASYDTRMRAAAEALGIPLFPLR